MIEERRSPSPQEIANKAADDAVRKVFAIMGVDIGNPAAVEEFRQDLRFGSKMRKVADKSIFAFWGVIAAALATAMITGLIDYIHRGN